MKQLLIICVLALALAGCSKKETDTPVTILTPESISVAHDSSAADTTSATSTVNTSTSSSTPSSTGKVAPPNSINSYGDVEIFGFDDDVDDDNDMDRFMEDYDY